MKVLFITTWPYKEASTRMRMSQYFETMKSAGIKPCLDSIFPEWYWKIKNNSNIVWQPIKIFFLPIFLFLRILRLIRVVNYDLIFVHREVFPFFTPIFERLCKYLSNKFIYDFDDAIYLSPVKWKNWRDYLRDPKNISEVCAISDTVIVGNDVLADYARQFSASVHVIPTVYKIEKQPLKQENIIPVIGWVGSWSTLINLKMLENVFPELALKYRFVLRLIGARNIYNVKLNNVIIDYVLWTIENEVNEISKFDIGIMPLFDSEWERGKCGFKLIQYMSLSIPVIASPVGANQTIVKNDLTGYLAGNEKEWYDVLEKLIVDKETRSMLGKNGKEFIEKEFSFEQHSTRLIELIKFKKCEL